MKKNFIDRFLRNVKIFLKIDRCTILSAPANINSAKFVILKIFLKFGEISSFKSYLAETRNVLAGTKFRL